MSEKDADMVQLIFDKKEDPCFSIINRTKIPNSNAVIMEIIFSTPIDMWFLAKEVAHEEALAILSKKIAV